MDFIKFNVSNYWQEWANKYAHRSIDENKKTFGVP